MTQRSGSERIADLERRLEEALKEIAGQRQLHTPTATVTNGDGSVICGESSDGPRIWEAANGARLFANLLTSMGVNLTNWSLTIRAISSDGKVIAGDGYRSGKFTSWIARL